MTNWKDGYLRRPSLLRSVGNSMLLSVVLCLVAIWPQQSRNHSAMFALGQELNGETTLVEADRVVKETTHAHEVQISQDGTIIDTSDTSNAAQFQLQSEEETLLKLIQSHHVALNLDKGSQRSRNQNPTPNIIFEQSRDRQRELKGRSAKARPRRRSSSRDGKGSSSSSKSSDGNEPTISPVSTSSSSKSATDSPVASVNPTISPLPTMTSGSKRSSSSKSGSDGEGSSSSCDENGKGKGSCSTSIDEGTHTN